MQRSVRSATLVLAVSASSLLTGCGAGSDMMEPLALPTSQINDAHAQSGDLVSVPTAPAVNAQQRSYLDALAAAGVKPSSDLQALTIGSYVCQARAAKQNDQAVWDLVLPLVRSDVRANHVVDGSASVGDESNGEVAAAASDYIRIATEQLC
ncbi:DUF732 domain-containing protein [Mycobacterium aquaticum]|uniref:DUF732 domain-containing protein n=1 Tax=Mycobacterium aquaticum TaxID=1927124 RepID=A0A1X0A6S0_9MYCO|nr:DUF732 domain-containing protein [Mycobacterium aquaticum]ORA25733.1 hypothetical protein BST13_32660 [Mycobacterium aquaticum]